MKINKIIMYNLKNGIVKNHKAHVQIKCDDEKTYVHYISGLKYKKFQINAVLENDSDTPCASLSQNGRYILIHFTTCKLKSIHAIIIDTETSPLLVDFKPIKLDFNTDDMSMDILNNKQVHVIIYSTNLCDYESFIMNFDTNEIIARTSVINGVEQ